jgi:hypothetical protein
MSDLEMMAACANPRCDEQLLVSLGGQRHRYHSDECRRSAERDVLRAGRRVEHYRRQLVQATDELRAYLPALSPTPVDPLDRARFGSTSGRRNRTIPHRRRRRHRGRLPRPLPRGRPARRARLSSPVKVGNVGPTRKNLGMNVVTRDVHNRWQSVGWETASRRHRHTAAIVATIFGAIWLSMFLYIAPTLIPAIRGLGVAWSSTTLPRYFLTPRSSRSSVALF